MPELPEVETVRIALEKAILNRCFIKIQCKRLSLRYPLPNNFDAIINRTVIDVRRRAKYLLLDFDNDYILMWHLGMSGRVIIKSELKPHLSNVTVRENSKHNHIIFYSSNNLQIIYNDIRRFGFLRLMTKQEITILPAFNDLGPEPLASLFDVDILYNNLQRRDVFIKTALLDQKIIAGIGNIYACEALWLSQISPFRRSNDINKSEVVTLIAAIQNVLRRAIEYGGSTLKDHAQPDGEIGYFQNYLNVYNCKDKVCSTCQINKIIKMKQSGRSTYYCDYCQV